MSPIARGAKYLPIVATLLLLHENSQEEKSSAGISARAKLAILSRGMRDRLSDVSPVEMFPALSEHFFAINDEKYEARAMVVASLYAYAHKDIEQEDGVSLGHAMRKVAIERESGSVETRIMAFLKSDVEHLPGHLRQLVSLLKATERARQFGLDWNMLFTHVLNWDHRENHVQNKIIRDYYTDSAHNPSNPLNDDVDLADPNTTYGE